MPVENKLLAESNESKEKLNSSEKAQMEAINKTLAASANDQTILEEPRTKAFIKSVEDRINGTKDQNNAPRPIIEVKDPLQGALNKSADTIVKITNLLNPGSRTNPDSKWIIESLKAGNATDFLGKIKSESQNMGAGDHKNGVPAVLNFFKNSLGIDPDALKDHVYPTGRVDDNGSSINNDRLTTFLQGKDVIVTVPNIYLSQRSPADQATLMNIIGGSAAVSNGGKDLTITYNANKIFEDLRSIYAENNIHPRIDNNLTAINSTSTVLDGERGGNVKKIENINTKTTVNQILRNKAAPDYRNSNGVELTRAEDKGVIDGVNSRNVNTINALFADDRQIDTSKLIYSKSKEKELGEGELKNFLDKPLIPGLYDDLTGANPSIRDLNNRMAEDKLRGALYTIKATTIKNVGGGGPQQFFLLTEYALDPRTLEQSNNGKAINQADHKKAENLLKKQVDDVFTDPTDGITAKINHINSILPTGSAIANDTQANQIVQDLKDIYKSQLQVAKTVETGTKFGINVDGRMDPINSKYNECKDKLTKYVNDNAEKQVKENIINALANGQSLSALPPPPPPAVNTTDLGITVENHMTASNIAKNILDITGKTLKDEGAITFKQTIQENGKNVDKYIVVTKESLDGKDTYSFKELRDVDHSFGQNNHFDRDRQVGSLSDKIPSGTIVPLTSSDGRITSSVDKSTDVVTEYPKGVTKENFVRNDGRTLTKYTKNAPAKEGYAGDVVRTYSKYEGGNVAPLYVINNTPTTSTDFFMQTKGFDDAAKLNDLSSLNITASSDLQKNGWVKQP